MQKFNIVFIISLLITSCTHIIPENIPGLNYNIQEKEPVIINGFSFHHIDVPTEIIFQIFSELSVIDIAQASQVCRAWSHLSADPALWKVIRKNISGDYPTNLATKEQAILHTLRVHVNSSTDLKLMEQLINKYDLNKNRPFIHYQTLVLKVLPKLSRLIIEEQAIQGDDLAIQRKIKRMANGNHGYKMDAEAAIAYNEYLISQNNQQAILRKIKGLASGFYGYKEDPKAAVFFNDFFVKQNSPKAIELKIKGLSSGFYGYKKNLEEANVFIESLVREDNPKAIEFKIRGLYYGRYGYKEDSEASVVLNEELVRKGDTKAIRRKIDGIADDRYGYDEDLDAAIALNEHLIQQGYEGSIIRKVKELSKKKHRYDINVWIYKKDLTQIKNWLEEEVSKGTRWACYLKAKGLKYGIFGFEKDVEAAISFIKKYNMPY